MKKIILIISSLFFSYTLFGQVSGNINYLNNVHYPNTNIDFPFTKNNETIFEVKGLSNIKADSYVAIFNVTQTGKNSEDANKLFNDRIVVIKGFIESKSDASLYIDMISFVPIYGYAIEKKLFSKKTYNEIPKGFELQKNIHIKYKDPELLNKIITICSKSEIYDLIKVDYFIDNLEQKKKELTTKARMLIKDKIANYQDIIGVDITELKKEMIEGFTVKYPTEMYKSFQSYSNTSLNLKKSAKVNTARKATKLYYQPIVEKEFDFVVNASFIEPVIQLMYQIKIKVHAKIEKTNNTETKYILVTPNGDLKDLIITKH